MKPNLAHKAKLTGKHVVEWLVEQPRVMKCVKARLLVIFLHISMVLQPKEIYSSLFRTSTD